MFRKRKRIDSVQENNVELFSIDTDNDIDLENNIENSDSGNQIDISFRIDNTDSGSNDSVAANCIRAESAVNKFECK